MVFHWLLSKIQRTPCTMACSNGGCGQRSGCPSDPWCQLVVTTYYRQQRYAGSQECKRLWGCKCFFLVCAGMLILLEWLGTLDHPAPHALHVACSNLLLVPGPGNRHSFRSRWHWRTSVRTSHEMRAVRTSPTEDPATLSNATHNSTSTVRIVAISDTHGFHKDLIIPKGDILVHCGDADGGDCGGVSFSLFAKWFVRKTHPYRLFILGNHDYRFRKELKEFRLQGSRTIMGLKFHALSYDRGTASYDRIPKDLDVLVTHDPPYGVRDLSYLQTHIGCRKLTRQLRDMGSKAPLLHLFGHVHEARGLAQSKHGNTLFANVANANSGEATHLEHGCMIFDITTTSTGEKTVEVIKQTSDGLRSQEEPVLPLTSMEKKVLRRQQSSDYKTLRSR